MKTYEKIRQLREEKKWSQEYMASRLGLSPNGYAKIERGETRLTLTRLNEVAQILEIDIFELMQSETQNIDYQIGNNHINHSRDFTIYGSFEHKDLIQELEKLKLVIRHQEEMLAHKELLLNQQSRELEMAQKMLAMYQQQPSQ